jgi:hypothetical protein
MSMSSKGGPRMPVDSLKLRASIPFFREIEAALVDRLVPNVSK